MKLRRTQKIAPFILGNPVDRILMVMGGVELVLDPPTLQSGSLPPKH